VKKLAAAGCIAAVLFAIAVHADDGQPEMPKPQKEHEWLKQLVGEWDTEGECVTEPGKPPMKTKGSESTRAIGGFWTLSEHKGDAMGTPFTGILTLGYSAEKKKYVGTWIDSMGSHLWTYEGSLDASGKVLSLETEGPSNEGPGKTCKFKEVI
jgi:hypothetical protein